MKNVTNSILFLLKMYQLSNLPAIVIYLLATILTAAWLYLRLANPQSTRSADWLHLSDCSGLLLRSMSSLPQYNSN